MTDHIDLAYLRKGKILSKKAFRERSLRDVRLGHLHAPPTGNGVFKDQRLLHLTPPAWSWNRIWEIR